MTSFRSVFELKITRKLKCNKSKTRQLKSYFDGVFYLYVIIPWFRAVGWTKWFKLDILYIAFITIIHHRNILILWERAYGLIIRFNIIPLGPLTHSMSSISSLDLCSCFSSGQLKNNQLPTLMTPEKLGKNDVPDYC